MWSEGEDTGTQFIKTEVEQLSLKVLNNYF